MICTTCGSPAVQPTGYCGNCGAPVSPPSAAVPGQPTPTAPGPFNGVPTNPPPGAYDTTPSYYATPPPPVQPYGPPPGQPYGPPPGQPYGVYGPPKQVGNVLSIVAFVLAGIAVLIVPILFGLASIVCGVVAQRRGERLGKLAIVLGCAGLVVGLAFGVLVQLL